MIGVDGLRALIVLIPVAAFYLGHVTLTVLLVTALAVSALGAFFDPALQATLPDVSPDLEILEAATGLMGTTVRLARAVGPAIVGLLGPLLPTIHFFTLDSASFAVSAYAISRLTPSRQSAAASRARKLSGQPDFGLPRDRRRPDDERPASGPARPSPPFGGWRSGSGSPCSCGWRPGDMRAFGWTVALYGMGNVAGALFVGNMRRRRPAFIRYWGYVCLGLGFIAMGASRNLAWLGAAGACAGFGGPINDVPFFDLVRRGFPIDDLPKIFRLHGRRDGGHLAADVRVAAVVPRVLSGNGADGLRRRDPGAGRRGLDVPRRAGVNAA